MLTIQTSEDDGYNRNNKVYTTKNKPKSNNSITIMIIVEPKSS